jgi:hypothetical protein
VKWLSRLRGKDGEEFPATLAFAELDAWLEQVSNSLFRELSENAAHCYAEIAAVLEQLKDRIVQLQTAESTEQVPDRIAKIGLLYRDRMAKHLAIVAEKLVIPSQMDYQTVQSFYKEAISNLEYPFGKSERNVFCVRSLFPAEIKELIAELNQLRTTLNQLIAPLKGKEQLIQDWELVPVLVRALKELQAGRAKEGESIHARAETVSMLRRESEGEANRLRVLEAGDDWKRYKALEADLGAVEAEYTEFEMNVRKLFVPLTKPLELLQKQDETGRHSLSPETRRAVTALLASPLDSLGDELPDYLRAIQRTIVEDPLVLKDRKREHALNWLEKLLQANFSALRETQQRLLTQRTAIRAKLSDMPVLAEKEQLEHARGTIQTQLRYLAEEIERSRNRLEILAAEQTLKQQELRAALGRITGKQIEVIFAEE